MLSVIHITKYFIEYLLYTKFQIAINIVGSYRIILLLLKVRGIYIKNVSDIEVLSFMAYNVLSVHRDSCSV